MRVLVNKITDEPEKGRVRLFVEFGTEGEKEYLGDFDGADPKYKSFNLEEELFMRLSDLAHKRYCDCTCSGRIRSGFVIDLSEEARPM